MRIARAIASGIIVAFLIVGVFVALLAYGRLPTTDELVDLPNEMLTDTTVFILLTLLAWAAWALFTGTVALEIAVEISGNRRRRLPASTPFQVVARRLVAAITMSATLSGPLLTRSGLTPSLATAAAATEQAPPLSGTPLALTNSSFTEEPARVLPAAPELSPTSAEPAPDAPAATLPVVTVVAHDSPWAIAERHLGQGLRWREIWELNRGAPQPDGRAWIREDLIQPGWRLQLPPDAINVAPAPAPSPPPDPTPAPAVPSTGRSKPVVTPTPGSGHLDDGGDHRAPSSEPATCGTDDGAPPERSEPSLPPTTTPSTPTGEEGPSAPTSDLLPTLLGITGATVVATGLAFQLRRRRRRRMAATARTPWGPETTSERQTEAAIASASDLPLVQWAGYHLANLPKEAARRSDGGPVAVELSADTGMELLWDTPSPKAAPPWTAADGGWAWRLAYDPDGAVPLNDQPAGIPGLATIGRRSERQLLIDLEAFGSLSVVGDPQRSNDLVRAIVFELASSEELASAQVVLADFDLVGVEQLPRVRHDTAEGALDRIRGTVSAVEHALESSTSSSTFGCRAHTWIDATVVIVHSDNPRAEELVDASTARRGVATIVVGPAPAAAARITTRLDGTADLVPLGLTFDLAGLPATSATDVATLLEELDKIPAPETSSDTSQQLTLPADPVEHGNGTADTSSTSAADEPSVSNNGAGPHRDDLDDDHEPMWPPLMVKVLGRPHVPARPGLKRRELALVVYLASKGQPTPAASVQHAVWNGRAVQTKTVWNLATATRAALGQLDDGTAAMPASQRAHNTLALAPGVRTDLQVMQDLYERAEHASSAHAIELLQQGLDLIEGQPFDGADFEWAHHTELLVAQATRLIEGAAERLVELALDAGRIDLARHAITQGLRALPGNEVLYRARMNVEHGDGNLAAVRSAYDELVSFLADIDADPSQSTIDLYRNLRPHRGRHAS
jgi:DNA-binding SARP family transcriptional activator